MEGQILLYSPFIFAYRKKDFQIEGLFLLYGKNKSKGLKKSVDLTKAKLLIDSKSTRKFKLISPDHKLRFRAMKAEQRDEIVKFIEPMCKEADDVKVSRFSIPIFHSRGKKKPTGKGAIEAQNGHSGPTLNQLAEMISDKHSSLNKNIELVQEHYNAFSD